MVVYKLKRGNQMGLILVETLNDLDAFHRKEASFFVRSPLLCEKSFSSSGIIPNFCLGSQPSEIPLTLQPFNFQLIEAPYIVFHYHLFFSTHALFFFLCFPSLSLSLFFFFFPNIATRKALVASTFYCTPQHIPL